MGNQKTNIFLFALGAWAVGVTTYLVVQKPPTVIHRDTEQTTQMNDSGHVKRPDASPYERREVKNTLMKSAKSFQECWLEVLKRKPKIEEAMIHMDWRIQPGGKVEKVEVVRNTIDDDKMSSCMIEKVGKLDFPPPPSTGQETFVEHKFLFAKEGAAPKRPTLVPTNPDGSIKE